MMAIQTLQMTEFNVTELVLETCLFCLVAVVILQ
jgi:hypothetical protein